MEFKSQANKIHDFLKRHENIWRYEILDTYPESLTIVPQEWIDDLWNLDLHLWHDFESKRILNTLTSPTLKIFLDEIKELSQIEPVHHNKTNELEDWAYKDVKAKKRHEINIIAPYVKDLQAKSKFKKLIDIGGGVGHLARITSYYYQIPSISIDKDLAFQKIGKERLTRYRKPEGGADVEFFNIEYSKEKIVVLKEKVNESSFTLGLHTCGPLAVEVIETSLELKNKGLLSFGCCYHKLHNSNRFPISHFYKVNNTLKLTLFAFTLASRAHSPTEFYEFETKYLVKNFRHGLHLFFINKLNMKNMFEVGEIHVRNYRNSFADYVLDRLEFLKIDCPYTRDEINQFYNEESTQRTLKQMFILNLIRWQIGRVLEVYLLIDRAIYCQENNYQVKINTFFDEEISPRNIGITAIKIDNEVDKF